MTYRDDVRRDPTLDVLLRLRVKLFFRHDDTGVFGWRCGTLVPMCKKPKKTKHAKKKKEVKRGHSVGQDSRLELDK